jgi:hypothetical protein
MKLNNLLAKSLLATAGATLLQMQAQATLPYANGDLIMGFRTTGPSNPDGLNSPAGTDYEINLGNATNFLNASGTINFANIGADLTAIFGPDWNTRADLFWSISGVVTPAVPGTFANNTMFVTRPETTLGIQSVPWDRISTFGSGAPAQKMVGMAGASFGYAAGTSATLNQLESVNTIGGLIQNTGGGNSYASYMPGGANSNGSSAFGTFSGGIEGTFGAGTAGTVLDLYELIPGSGPSAYIGTFQINDIGTASFTAVVPEPSSLAIIGAGAGLLGLLRRRQQRA